MRAFQISEHDEESKDNKGNSLVGLNSWLQEEMKRVDPEAIAVRRNTVTVVTSKPTDKNKSRKKDRSYKINLNKLDDEKIFGKSEVRML